VDTIISIYQQGYGDVGSKTDIDDVMGFLFSDKYISIFFFILFLPKLSLVWIIKALKSLMIIVYVLGLTKLLLIKTVYLS